jgi:CRP-like cAMP-binding protein
MSQPKRSAQATAEAVAGVELEAIEIGRIQRIHTLRSLSGMQSVSTAALAALAAHAMPVRIPSGTRIASEGRPTGIVYILLEGGLQTSQNGRMLGAYGPRTAVGLLPVLARDTSGFTVEAVRDSTAFALHAEDVLEVLEDHFDMMHAVMRSLALEAVAVRRALTDDGGYQGETLAGVEYPSEPLDLVERLFCLRHTFPLGNSHLDALAEIARASYEVHYPAGMTLWSMGDRSQHLLILVCGIVRGTTADGAEFRFGPRDVVGSLDMVAEVPRWFEAVIEEDVVALSHDRDMMADLWEDHPELGLDFLQLFSTTLLGLREQLAEQDPTHLSLLSVAS